MPAEDNAEEEAEATAEGALRSEALGEEEERSNALTPLPVAEEKPAENSAEKEAEATAVSRSEPQ